MASTPLYKFLKNQATSFYCLPSSAEDFNAAYQNSNYKMYFSKFALVNFPKQNLTAGTSSNPIIMDFDNSFYRSVNATPTTNFSSAIIESLRNYVANQEVTIKESRLSNNKYFYDTNILETTSEKIFFKWAKKLNLIDFEPAIPEDEYFSNLLEFQRGNLNDPTYFPEYLWKERDVIAWTPLYFYESGVSGYVGKMEIEFSSNTNFKVGDKINIYNISNTTIINNGGYNDRLIGSDTEEGIYANILYIIPADSTKGQRIVIDIDTTISTQTDSTCLIQLVYNRFVQYIGEISGVSNVQEANRSYTEVYAHIPDHTGRTPDILFRTRYDINYKPNLTFPILPSQYQPEILGAELFSSPIVTNPQNYPGSYFAQYDTPDFTYETSTGDYLRRSGSYFGINGDINNPIVNSNKLDGLGIDFNTNHYVKMNGYNNTITNFDQFNALEVNNEIPSDFEFNAILWYYDVQKTDSDGNLNTTTNLYGISFLDNPDNNPIESEKYKRFPTYKKLVSNGEHDGTSYAFNLNLNFNIINDNPQLTYNPEANNSLFSMNLFNDAMRRLASTNDSFLQIISENIVIKEELNNLRQLLYTQTDIDTINTKISSLEKLLRLYSTNQITDSNSIKVSILPNSPSSIALYNIEPSYDKIFNIKTSNLYNTNTIIPTNISVPENKNFLINVINDDVTELNTDNLTLLLDKDLYYKQSVDIIINATELSTQNKKLDIYVNTIVPSMNNLVTTEALLIGELDLPIYFNAKLNQPNSAYNWSDFRIDIDFDKTIQYNNNLLEIPMDMNHLIVNNSIKNGDVLNLSNLHLNTGTYSIDYSGQYEVNNVGATNSIVYMDISSNVQLTNLCKSTPLIHSATSSILVNTPYFKLNKGMKIRITRINELDTIMSDKYQIEITELK